MKWFNERTIVAPFDFSDDSREAVALANELAVDSSDLHVLHVIPPLVVSEPGVVWGAVDDASRINHAREEMKKALEYLNAPDIHLEVRIGDAGHQICNFAEEVGAGLIIVGSHGRTGLKRVLLGSVAERVTRHAACPVLVVKPEKQAKREAKKSETAEAATQ